MSGIVEANFSNKDSGIVSRSPGDAKGYCRITAAGLLAAGSYNVVDITDTGTGNRAIIWDTDFADANYAAVALNADGNVSDQGYAYNNFAAGSVGFFTAESGALTDRASSNAAFGDQ
jgi:hypothetical protein